METWSLGLSRDICIKIYSILALFVPPRQYPVFIFHFDTMAYVFPFSVILICVVSNSDPNTLCV